MTRPCGVFTTLQPVGSANARAEIASKGDFTVSGQRFPRAQLWSISDHFDNRLPTLPMLADPYTGKPMQQTLPHYRKDSDGRTARPRGRDTADTARSVEAKGPQVTQV